MICQLFDLLKGSFPAEKLSFTNYANEADILISSCFGNNKSNKNTKEHYQRGTLFIENILGKSRKFTI